MPRLNQKRQNQLEPVRVDYAKQKLTEIGATVLSETDKEIKFQYKNITATIFPYSGWWSGKGIGSDRGIDKMLNALKNIK